MTYAFWSKSTSNKTFFEKACGQVLNHSQKSINQQLKPQLSKLPNHCQKRPWKLQRWSSTSLYVEYSSGYSTQFTNCLNHKYQTHLGPQVGQVVWDPPLPPHTWSRGCYSQSGTHAAWGVNPKVTGMGTVCGTAWPAVQLPQPHCIACSIHPTSLRTAPHTVPTPSSPGPMYAAHGTWKRHM